MGFREGCPSSQGFSIIEVQQAGPFMVNPELVEGPSVRGSTGSP